MAKPTPPMYVFRGMGYTELLGYVTDLEAREQALAAHVERLSAAGTAMSKSRGGRELRGRVRAWEDVTESAPATSLARRDLLNQAKGMADAARRLNNMSHPKAADFFKQGAVKHLEYQADKLRRQAEGEDQ